MINKSVNHRYSESKGGNSLGILSNAVGELKASGSNRKSNEVKTPHKRLWDCQASIVPAIIELNCPIQE